MDHRSRGKTKPIKILEENQPNAKENSNAGTKTKNKKL